MGHTEAGYKRAFDLYQGFSGDRGVEDVGASLAALRALPEFAGKSGVLGFCLERQACLPGRLPSEGRGLRGRLLRHGHRVEPRRTFTRERAAGSAHRGQRRRLPAARAAGDHRREVGPHYDFSVLWEKHCEYGFATRDVAATMKIMVAEPNVNHVPAMTGGAGYNNLRRFYQNHFVNGNPPDTALIPVSRTVGATQIVDEILFCFTHTCEIDWMLPGVAPTGKRVEIPLVAVIKFRGDKLYHEHIYWDQASVLVQIGLLDPKGLPVAGIETARKLIDETLPSSTLMARWKESEGK